MELSDSLVKEFKNNFEGSPKYRLAQNAISRLELRDVSMNTTRLFEISHTFSDLVEGELAGTFQQKSGRCWIFAALNQLRIRFAKQYKLEKFEFSQNYLFFYDKLEKANCFLESIIETANEPFDSRLVMFLLSHPMQDGGQWHMFVNLVDKYGLVPKSIFPDTAACINSQEMNYTLTLRLREGAFHLREMITKGRGREELTKVKESILEEIYRMLAMHLGTPPTHFSWEYRDKDKKFHSHHNLTPKSFYEKIVKDDLHDYVCLVNSPREKTPYYKSYTIAYLGNVIEGQKVIYVNVPIEEMKTATIKSLKDHQPVWFGCDVGKCFHREKGVMDLHLYDWDKLYDVPFQMTKEMSMNYGESKMTHAMLFTGVHLVNDMPIRFRVENSWGEAVGDKGYFTMTDTWFDRYMYEVAIHKKYLPKKITQVATTEPVVLDPWDPLGALALSE